MKLNIAAAILLSVTQNVDAFIISGSKNTLSTPFVHIENERRRPDKYGLRMSTVEKETSLGVSESTISSLVNENIVLSKPDIITRTRNYAAAYISKHNGETGSSVIYTKLLEYGVKLVNGYSGGANLSLLDQFHEDHPRHKKDGAPPPIRWITNSNENSAGHVMEGYAKASRAVNGKVTPGVVIATSGPGVTNLITPLQDAICDGVPMIVMCGQAATFAPPDAFQSADAVGLTTPCTKWS